MTTDAWPTWLKCLIAGSTGFCTGFLAVVATSSASGHHTSEAARAHRKPAATTTPIPEKQATAAGTAGPPATPIAWQPHPSQAQRPHGEPSTASPLQREHLAGTLIMAENALADARIPQPPSTHVPLVGQPYKRQPTPPEQTQAPATLPDQGRPITETLLKEATRTVESALDEGGRAAGTALSEGKRTAGTALDEGSHTAGQALDEGRRTAGRALDEGGRAAGTVLDEGSRVAGTVLGEGRRAAGTVLEEGRRAIDGPARRKSPGAVRPRERGTSRTKGEIAVAAALRHLGVAFSWGGGSPAGPTLGIGKGAATRGFDCSGLTLHAWSKAGVKLGHYTGTQFRQGRRVPLADRRPGDLLFFGGGTGAPTHVGLFVRGSLMVHAPKTGDVVRKANFLKPGYFRTSFRGVVRPT